jgi:hypothetical protein
VVFSANFADVLCDLCGQLRAFNRQVREGFAKEAKKCTSEGADGNARASRVFCEGALERKQLLGLSRLFFFHEYSAISTQH